MSNALYFQSGGPTAVINASFYGVIEACSKTEEIGTLYASRFGLKGVLNDDLIEISKDIEQYKEVPYLNGAIIGTARLQLKDPKKDENYQKVYETCVKHDIKYVFVNGGNDSMDTADKLNKYFKKIGYDAKVVGVPKTIDNDLVMTDHCPGFGSAVKYVVRTMMELYLDINAFNPGRVTVVEIMGRDAGWLAASSVGASIWGAGPDLIYVSEVAFDIDNFIADVKRVYEEKGRVLIAVSEALKDKDGNYHACDAELDSFGHVQLGSISKWLTNLVQAKLGYKTRNIEFSLVQRAACHIQSAQDRKEAIMVGKKAVQYALKGKVGMVAIERKEGDKYAPKFKRVPLSKVANAIKHMPREYINEAGNYINDSYLDYIRPFLDEKEIGMKSANLFINKK